MVSKCSDYGFVTTIAPVVRQKGDPGQISFLTPEEIAQTADLIKAAAGDSRQPYTLRFIDPKTADDEKRRTLEALPQNARFRYRSAARKYQFKTEILKD